MTEIAVRGPSGLAENPPAAMQYASPDPTGGRLVAWAQSLGAAHQIATALCRTTFVPRHFAGKPDEAAAAILFGDEIGMSPTQALRSVHVISGTPGLYAKTMVALVQSKGHEVWTELDTPSKVVVCGRRRGSQHVERSEWTVDRARKAGYTSNKKYETDPQAMLYARAASDVCRKVASDALAGLAFAVEEIELEDEQTPTATVSRAEPTKRTVARRQTAPPPPQDDPPLDDEPAPVPAADEPAVAGITEAQSKKLHALMRERGLTDRADALEYLSDAVGHPIETSKALTRDEASAVIDMLDAPPADPQSWPETATPGGEG